jgi:antitoxin component of MazEF toxin-antitoxin module
MFYKLTQIGNAIGITIPKKLLDLLGLKKGNEVMVIPDLEHRSITIVPISVAKKQVQEAKKRKKIAEVRNS